MAVIEFPYGKDRLSYDIPDDRFAGTLESRLSSFDPGDTEAALIDGALASPVGTARLSELARGKKRVVLIASDHTRPVPSKLIVPRMLSEIRAGNSEAEITILVATGCHRETTQDELIRKFGEEIVQNEHIVVHDCDDEENLVTIGTLPSGGMLRVNRLVTACDLLVSEGFIEPHFFAGFSGGRKSVLPGVASRETVIYNHNAAFIDDPRARTGILDGNPIHEDMLWAAKKAGLAFIVNVVIDPEKKVVFAVAGDAEAAHRQGCAFISRHCGVKTAAPAGIVITTNGGYPLDQNIYQSVKGMTAAEAAVIPGGVIIMLSKCSDGTGGQSFYETFRDEKDLKRMMAGFLATPPERTIIDQWQSQIFARVLMHADVIFISDAPDQTVHDLHMIPAHSIGEAVRIADSILEGRGSENRSILAIPDGVSVMVERA